MIHLDIKKGKLKRKTSLETLKNDLYDILEYEPRLNIDIENSLNGIISIDSKDKYTEYDILRILCNHCSYFKVEIDEVDYYESRFSSQYFIITSYYEWNGKNLVKRYRDFFGPTYQKEDYNWILKIERSI